MKKTCSCERFKWKENIPYHRCGRSLLGSKGQSSSKFQIELSEVNVYVRQ